MLGKLLFIRPVLLMLVTDHVRVSESNRTDINFILNVSIVRVIMFVTNPARVCYFDQN